MKTTNTFFIRVFLVICIFLLIGGSISAQFTADLLQTENGKTKTGKIYFNNSVYRMDLQEQGEDFYVIVDQNKKITRVVRPAKKMYVEMSSTGMSSIRNDVFQSVEKQKKLYKTNFVDSEKLNGYDCKKYEVLIDSNVVTTFWQSKKFNFPLKVITGRNNQMIAELKNISEGKIKDSYFKIPEEYKKVEMPGVK